MKVLFLYISALHDGFASIFFVARRSVRNMLRLRRMLGAMFTIISQRASSPLTFCGLFERGDNLRESVYVLKGSNDRW